MNFVVAVCGALPPEFWSFMAAPRRWTSAEAPVLRARLFLGFGVMFGVGFRGFTGVVLGMQGGRVAARIEATPLGLDIRYVVTSIKTGAPERLYAELYCQRGQAENLIKLHKTQLKSDRTSCRSPRANQMRLILHTAALLAYAHGEGRHRQNRSVGQS